MPAEPEDIEIWNALTDEQKIAAAAVVLGEVFEHIKAEEESYRYLIYDRLGLGDAAYCRCHLGMQISNYVYELKERLKTDG